MKNNTKNNFMKHDLIGLSPNSKLLQDYKKSLTSLSAAQIEAGIGLVLGDASLQTQNKGKTYRMKFEWGNKNKAYLDHVYILFNEWVLSFPHEKIRTSPKGNTVINWGFQTISHEAFLQLAGLFLNNNKKTFDNPSKAGDLIKDHLTGTGLAYWFMDDGGKWDYNKDSINKTLVLNTHSFLDGEVNAMAIALNNKFDLDCEVKSNKGKSIIIIKNYDNFIKLTNNKIIKEMRYKLPNN